MYNGLTTADKGALESYLRKGVDPCPMMLNGELKLVDTYLALAQIAEMESEQEHERQHREMLENSSVSMGINVLDIMEQKPMTWNDWFTGASLEERAAFILRYVENSCESWCMDYQPMGEHLGGCDQQCAKHLEHHLNSPYTEGETK